MDATGSLAENFDMEQKLARKIIYGLNFKGGRVQVGGILFAEDEAQQFQLNTYTTLEQVLNAFAFDVIGKEFIYSEAETM